MHLTLHLTTACNMNCSYCYSPPRDGEAMSSKTGRRAMDFASGMTNGSCGIIFFGGEPLLHKDRIWELVDYGRHLERNRAGRFHFKVTTNGVLLDEEFLSRSIHENLLVAMSFDGVREAQDKHRRLANGSPTFDYLLEKLKMLLEVRPYSSVMMVVNPDTAEHLCESVDLLIDLSCKYVIISLNYAADWRNEHFRVLESQMKRLARMYIKWTQEERKFYLSPFEVKISSHVNRHCYKKEQCELGAKQLSVDPGGYLYPCVQFTKAGADSEWCIGSVQEGIDERRRALIRERSEAQKESCVGCAIETRCNNSCGCLNWQATGSVRTVSPALCRFEQMLVPIADRMARRLYKKRNPVFLHKHYNAAYPVLSVLEDTLAGKGRRSP